jgi:hypothetical protein
MKLKLQETLLCYFKLYIAINGKDNNTYQIAIDNKKLRQLCFDTQETLICCKILCSGRCYLILGEESTHMIHSCRKMINLGNPGLILRKPC